MWRRGLIFLAMVAASVASQISLADTKLEVVLLTEREATQLRMSEADWEALPVPRSLSMGPNILVRAPEVTGAEVKPTVEALCPCNLLVAFEKNRAPVDMDSLEVIARKGIFSKSLTDRLKPYVRGNTLDVKDANIPKGKFQIEIAIADMKGDMTKKAYLFVVGVK